MRFKPKGVIPACILPFTERSEVDEPALRSHLRDVVAVKGIESIVVNGHSTEVNACTFAEQQRVLEIAVDEVGEKVAVISGVFSDSGLEACKVAEMAHRSGAAGLLVFPPSTFSLGMQQRDDVALDFVRRISDASNLDLILFQYPHRTGQQYSLSTLHRIADTVPGVVAIKDWCGDPVLHERHVRELQNRDRPIAVLTTHSAWLLSSLMSGCQGILSGSGSIIAHLHVQLFNAVIRGDLRAAFEAYEKVRLTAEVFYAEPWMDMHSRMKVALFLEGRIPSPTVRSPLLPLDEVEVSRIRRMLELLR